VRPKKWCIGLIICCILNWSCSCFLYLARVTSPELCFQCCEWCVSIGRFFCQVASFKDAEISSNFVNLNASHMTTTTSLLWWFPIYSKTEFIHFLQQKPTPQIAPSPAPPPHILYNPNQHMLTYSGFCPPGQALPAYPNYPIPMQVGISEQRKENPLRIVNWTVQRSTWLIIGYMVLVLFKLNHTWSVQSTWSLEQNHRYNNSSLMKTGMPGLSYNKSFWLSPWILMRG